MSFTLATWNINSVRLRIKLVLRFLRQVAPDVLCLQETKTVDEHFPRAAFEKAGFADVTPDGQERRVMRLILDRRA